MNIISWSWIVGAAVGNSLGNILLKQARIGYLGQGAAALMFSPKFVAAVLCCAFSLLSFTKGLNTVPISSAYPVQAGFVFIFVTILSYLLLNEPVSVQKAIGLTMIFAGITVVMR